MDSRVFSLGERILRGETPSREEFTFLTDEHQAPLDELLFMANRIRQQYVGNRVDCCSILNAKSGGCSEDCGFCAQSAHYDTGVVKYPMVGTEVVEEGLSRAIEAGADRFGLITSGERLGKKDLEKVEAALSRLKGPSPIPLCASFGNLEKDDVVRLKEAGVRRLHHNIETSENYFPNVITTHSFADRYNTAKAAKEAGMELCCGGIVGMGESWQDRLDMAFTVRELEAESVPVNFLNPIPGTKLGNRKTMRPLDALRTIAIFRFINPKAEIRVAGGREKTLRDLQSWVFQAGANSIMVGNYLTTMGRDPKLDIQMLEDLELNAEGIKHRVERVRELADGIAAQVSG